MKNTAGTEAAKRAAGEAAAAEVTDGDVVGLGTGSTAAHAVRDLGERVAEGLDIEGVATSYQSRALAKEVEIPLLSLSDVARVNLAIDGADQVDLGTNALVKGGGAAHAREKVVASAADEFLVVADDSKLAEPLASPVPVEVLPDALARVERAVGDAGGAPSLRAAERKDGPVITDNGNLVLDCDFGTIEKPASLAQTLSGVAGVVEHGLFVGMADAVFVGADDGGVTRTEPSGGDADHGPV